MAAQILDWRESGVQGLLLADYRPKLIRRRESDKAAKVFQDHSDRRAGCARYQYSATSTAAGTEASC